MAESTERSERLKNAAIEIIKEHLGSLDRPLKSTLAFVSPTAVANRAGCSRGLIYHLWGEATDTERGQAFERFLGDVADDLLQQTTDSDFLQAQLTETETPIAVLVRAIANSEIHRILRPEVRTGFLAETMLMSSASDPMLVAARLRWNEDGLPKLAEFYRTGFAMYGMELQDGLTPADFALMLVSVTNGFWLGILQDEQLSDERFDWPAADGKWSLYAIAVESIVRAAIRPISS